MDVNRIDPAEARGLLESEPGYICLDVRTAEEFAAGHVPAAVNIPVVEKNPMGPGLVPNPDFASQVEQQIRQGQENYHPLPEGGQIHARSHDDDGPRVYRGC